MPLLPDRDALATSPRRSTIEFRVIVTPFAKKRFIAAEYGTSLAEHFLQQGDAIYQLAKRLLGGRAPPRWLRPKAVRLIGAVQLILAPAMPQLITASRDLTSNARYFHSRQLAEWLTETATYRVAGQEYSARRQNLRAAACIGAFTVKTRTCAAADDII